MRQITKDSINAFMNAKKFKRQNMKVEVFPNVTILYLHNNAIAYRYNDPQRTLTISNCGWFSNTTKERLNALPNVHIVQRNFKWYLNGKEWDGKETDIKTLYLTILDFNDNHVYTYAIASNEWDHEETEQFLSSEGFRLKDINWMFHNNKLTYINETIY